MEFFKETDFKQTEIESIPKDWEISSVAETCEKPEYGYTQSAMYKPVGPKFLRITDIQNGNVNWSEVPYCQCPGSLIPKYELKSGDILFARTGATTGKSFLIKECPKAVFASYLIRIRRKEKVLPEYLFYFFNSKYYWDQIGQKMGGSAQGGMNASLLSELKIFFPDILEQKAAVSIISKIDSAIQQTDSIIQKTRELKKGLMQELLTKGIGHKEFKYSKELGCEIPKEWDVQKLEDIAQFKNGINFSKKQKGDEGILTVDVLNMYGENIYLNLKDLYRIDIDLKEESEYLLKKGDILFVRSSLKREGAAWASLFDGYSEDVTFCGFIIRARIKDANILPKFLTYYLRTDLARETLLSNSGQVAITNITQEAIKSLRIPILPISEQKKIVSILSNIDKKTGEERKTKTQLEALKKGLMQILLTGQVRIKVN